MQFIGVEVEQETSAPPRKETPRSAPERGGRQQRFDRVAFENLISDQYTETLQQNDWSPQQQTFIHGSETQQTVQSPVFS